MTPEATVARLFVAVHLPEAVRAALWEAQRELKKVLPPDSTAWPRPENFHLTVRFLGNVELPRIPELSERLAVAVAGFGEFDLVCERLGCFPDLRFPRVVWAWVHDEGARLVELHRRVAEAVKEFAEKPAEENFFGHITLARPKRLKRSDAERLAHFVEGAVTRRFGVWRVPAVALLRSQLSATGSSYEEVCRCNLA